MFFMGQWEKRKLVKVGRATEGAASLLVHPAAPRREFAPCEYFRAAAAIADQDERPHGLDTTVAVEILAD